MSKTKLTLSLLAFILVAFLVSSAVLSACAPVDNSTQIENVSSAVRRMIDEEAGVVCYYIWDNFGTAIDCLPIGETKLP